MTDAEISRRLALAIGWDVLPVSGGDDCACVVDHANQIDRYFDYRDPAISWAVAERFDCFPRQWDETGDSAWLAYCGDFGATFADTAAKAVALAVIKHHEGSKT